MLHDIHLAFGLHTVYWGLTYYNRIILSNDTTTSAFIKQHLLPSLTMLAAVLAALVMDTGGKRRDRVKIFGTTVGPGFVRKEGKSKD